MPDTHLPLHDARTTTERLFPTLPAAHIWRISTHGYVQRIPRCIDSMTPERVARLEALFDDVSVRRFDGHAVRFERCPQVGFQEWRVRVHSLRRATRTLTSSRTPCWCFSGPQDAPVPKVC